MNDSNISDHYLHGNLLHAIKEAISAQKKSLQNIAIKDLAPIDEFHIGGRLATEHLLKQLNFCEQHHILDVGCGLGGAARYVANKYHNQVSGIDLTGEYIETGKVLCEWVKLQDKVSLHHGNAVAMPFESESFDGGYMLHVGMNIDDKAALFKEIYRVLRKGAQFGVYDVMRVNAGELIYPVPWASDSSISNVSTLNEYKDALANTGFEIITQNCRRDFALNFFIDQRKKIEKNGGPPALSLHTLMKESTPLKIRNMVENIKAHYIAPVEIIVRKVP